MLIVEKILIITMVISWTAKVTSHRQFNREKILSLREEVRSMFQHAYDGYLNHASDYDELRPLTCDGVNTWGSYSLTLIDALDTLATMGNFSEFRRVAKLLEHKMDFDRNINVSVFETNIRIVGGLIGAHLLSKRAGVEVEEGWPCTGPLLRMAEDVAKRLLPAFDTATGMPYGTVNLRYGVPQGETPVTCTAGVGTFLIEFGALSRLTGNPVYEEVALNAVHSLWEHRSAIGLLGNHIDVQTGRWTAQDSGIGAGVDSFYEYLVKAAILLNRPSLLDMFHEARAAIDKYLKRDDWYIWAGMHKGQITLPVFQSLEAYWPGVLSLIGDINPAIRTLSKYNSVWKQYGFLPEFYNIPTGKATLNRESYPLRPELAESAMYLYRATKNNFLLEVGENMIRSIEYSAKTSCGYATIRNVLTHEKDNRMESFFLAETTKYLYLLFDEDNFLHNDETNGEVRQTPNGECVVHAGPYIFNTEAHPIDMSALFCCHNIHEDLFEVFREGAEIGDILAEPERQKRNAAKYECGSYASQENKFTIRQDSKISIDIEVFDENEIPAGDRLIRNFEKIRKERDAGSRRNLDNNQLTLADLNTFFSLGRDNFASIEEVCTYVVKFMKKFTLDRSQIRGLHVFDKSITSLLRPLEKDYEGDSKTLWELFQLKNKYAVNAKLMQRFGIRSLEYIDNPKLLEIILRTLKKYAKTEQLPTNMIEQHLYEAKIDYINALGNITAMQEFLFRILINSSAESKRTFKTLLDEKELQELILETTSDEVSDAAVLFENLHRVLLLKRRLFVTFLQLEIAEGYKQQRQKTKKSQTSKKSNVCNSTNSSSITSWIQLIEKISRTPPITKRSKFDGNTLPVATSANSLAWSKYSNIKRKNEILTCAAPPFNSRFAYRNLFR